eukprot:g9199.t1
MALPNAESISNMEGRGDNETFGSKYVFEQDLETTSTATCNDKVVSFDQDIENDDKRTDREKSENLHPIIQKIMKWQIARHKITAFLLGITSYGLNFSLFFGYLFSNMYIGLAMGIYMGLFQSVYLTIPDYGTGVFLTLFIENEEEMVKTAKGLVGATYFQTILGSGATLVFQVFALNPENPSYNIFGPSTKYLIYANFIIYPVCTQILAYMFIADQNVTSVYAKYWGKKIKSYINTVRECLLKYDIKKDNKVECLRAISHHQEKVEKMALEINAKMSTMMGVWFTFMIGFLMLSLVTIGVLQTVSENGSKTGEIAGLSIFTLLWGGMFVYVLWDVTQINKTWESQRKIVLNDSILQIQIEALFGQRFNEWMRNHEVAAARALGVQITSVRLWEVGSIVCSLLTIAGYFIVREELRALM